MGEAILRRRPAVALRSWFSEWRATLVVALIAVASLTAAVVILATDGENAGGTSPLPRAVPVQQFQDASPGTAAKHEAATAAAIGHPGSATEMKHEAATAAAVGQSSDGTVTSGSKTDPHGPASLLP
jgi:hypothetical protein